MQDWLAARANVSPNKIALIWRNRHWTFSELDLLTHMTSERLKQVGLRRGRTVGMLMPNSLDAVVTIHAVARLGCILVPLNLRLSTDELNWQLQQANVRLLLFSTETSEQASKLNPNRMQLDVLNLPHSPIVPPSPTPVDLTATQAIVFTSGTSGKPKGAEITFGNHFYSAVGSSYRLGHNPHDRWLSVLPLYHVGGLAVIFRCTLYGITTVLHERFDIKPLQASFDNHSVTLISVVPTMLYRMLTADFRWGDSLRLILLGGAAATSELLERAFMVNLPIATTYGLTEAASQVATMLPPDVKRKPGSVGKPLMFSSVRVVDETGNDVQTGGYGEIVVKGPTVMKGYLRNPIATENALRQGWLYTGDIGYFDVDGDLWLVQRRSDLIVSGGENVYPAEVEQILREHPTVEDVCVVGLDDPEWGQVVVAAVVLAEHAIPHDEDLIDYCSARLARYKQPRQFRYVAELPKTASGKVQRDGVRKLFSQSHLK